MLQFQIFFPDFCEKGLPFRRLNTKSSERSISLVIEVFLDGGGIAHLSAEIGVDTVDVSEEYKKCFIVLLTMIEP